MINRQLTGLSLEAMGLLLMMHKGINESDVHSSRVTIESAKEELVSKGILKYATEDDQKCGCN